MGTGLPQRLDKRLRPAFPKLILSNQRELDFVRTFSCDRDVKRGEFNRVSDRLLGWNDEDEQPETWANPRGKAQPQEAAKLSESQRNKVVPDSVHAVQPVQSRSLLKDLTDSIAGLSSDSALSMMEPKNVTLDSRQRVVVTDPLAHAVHVFDFKQKRYFRIQGGEGRRLQSPHGVAVDAQDNIYVTDAERGVVLVYDSEGKFRRYIGKLQNGEAFYDKPTGIAIDRKAGRIYLSDTPRHLIFVLDLEGNVLARFGKRGGDEKEAGSFKYPTSLVINGDELVVEDANGCRLQILDLQGNSRSQFRISQKNCEAPSRSGGLAVDSKGNIYAANVSVLVFDHAGRFVDSFGPTGGSRGEFRDPSGIWIDADDRLYVADTTNHRVQVFQVRDVSK